DSETISQAVDAGMDNYLTKPFSVAQCLAMLSCSLLSRSSAKLNGTANGEFLQSHQLTNRENEVMSRLAKGLLYKEIADELRISYSAVNKHQHNIFRKFRVNNRSEAISRWNNQQPL